MFIHARHNILLETLRDIGVDGKYIPVIANLIRNKTSVVRIDGVDTTLINIKSRVWQGCILSLILFKVYSRRGHIGKIMNNLHYADDTVILASNQEDLQSILNKVVCAIVGLDLNIKKTKVIVISKLPKIARLDISAVY